MKPIVTLTLNPAIDSSCQADEVRPVHKVRTFEERYDPGGGGINVARVIRELGGEALAVYLAGGLTGQAFTHMVDAIGLQHRAIHIRGYTRVSHTVYERSSGQEYRFVPQGPEIHADEWQACLRELEDLEFDYLVASGSLPKGVPDDFYARVARMVSEKAARFVLDSSGEALKRALEAGVYLVKPNLRELESVVGRSLRKPAEQEEAASQLVACGRAEIVTVSLGADGALLATGAGCRRLRAPKVKPRSAVGAGDSFVGAMTLGLAEGRTPEDAFARAVATGTATVLTMGTELCRREDVERIYRQIKAEQIAPVSAGPH
ncbi:MAG TPA: 1-phosphofructokinase family hexose kinase [Geminicoccaceae bacterium]